MESRIEESLATIQPALQVDGRHYEGETIGQLMARNNIPAVSIAVVDGGRIVWSGAYGNRVAGENATTATVFQAASLSKPVAALATTELVEAGRLSLDEPVNAWLRSWRIPDGDGKRGDAVTLRQILGHRSGLGVSGFNGYEPGLPTPTLSQILDGEAPANSVPIRLVAAPGEKFQYSGGGYVVLQQLIEDVTDTDFADLMRRSVLQPLGMQDSTFEYAEKPTIQRELASGHKADGSSWAGGYNVQPELAAAGLWTTPTDMARLMAEIMTAYAGGKSRVLDGGLAKTMLAPGEGGWGLGLQASTQGEELRVSYSGANAGFRNLMVGYPDRGQAVVIMTNSDAGDTMFQPLIMALGRTMGWPDSEPFVVRPVPFSASEMEAVLGNYAGGPVQLEIVLRGDRLFAVRSGGEETELVHIGEGRLLGLENGARARIVKRDGTDKITGLSLGGLTPEKVD